MADQKASERLALIRENLAEILNPEIIEKIVNEGGHPKIYWGKRLQLRHARQYRRGRYWE